MSIRRRIISTCNGLFLVAGVVSAGARGAACCGAGASVPGLLMDDEHTRVTMTSRFVRLVGVSDDDGMLLRDNGWHDDTLLLNLEVATLLSDRWSLGARAGVGRHALPVAAADTASAGVGDITGVLAYEYLPEWTSLSVLPRGVAFLAITAPTGEADPASAAPLGRGYWSFALGTSFTKTLGGFDVYLVPQVGAGIRQVAVPGALGGNDEWTAATSIGFGYTPARIPIRLGFRIDPQIRWPKGLPERWSAPVSADVSVQLGDAWRVALTVEDQTLFPLHRNMSLGQGIALAVWHRWLR